jgi:hypothetical protein
MTALAFESLEQARRSMAAADALWRVGLVGEANRFVESALRSTLLAWVPGEAPSSDLDRALAALERAGYATPERARRALAASAPSTSATTPEAALDGAASRIDLDELWGEAERLLNFTTKRLVPSTRRRRSRLLWGGGALGLFLAVLVVDRLWVRPNATASGVFSPEYPAAYAIDGIESTEWVLPDHTPGWLEIAYSSARRLRSVRIVNGHNSPYLDRASERVRVTAFADEGAVATVEGRFPRLMPERSVLELPLDARHVTHLRVDVLSYFGSGGGLAEVEAK